MPIEKKYLSEAGVYAGFGSITRRVLVAWKNFVVEYEDLESTKSILNELSQQLRSQNAILFFDHHYAFDAIPLGLGLAKYIDTIQGLLIPYAAHLDMGVGREGEFSIRYKLRTSAFEWLVSNTTKNNFGVKFLPVVRSFEMDTPRIRKIVDQAYTGANPKYIKAFIRMFAKNQAGQVCFLTPFSGIAFPGKPALHPQLYRSINLVQTNCAQDIPFYFVGAYPSWHAYRQYFAPLLIKHKIAVRGPFSLPIKDYARAKSVVEDELHALREKADFVPPEYDRILKK
jgi:hypothetical protein